MVVVLDVDTEPWPLRPLRSRDEKKALAHWLWLLRCFRSQNHSLFSISDHSAPVHGGYFLLKPNVTLHDEGIAVLRRAARGAFNVRDGWDLVGRPRQAVPRSDPAWEIVRHRSMEMFSRNDHSYVCGSSDQGFFFHMYRIRHRMGADMRFAPRCQPSVARRFTPQIGHCARRPAFWPCSRLQTCWPHLHARPMMCAPRRRRAAQIPAVADGAEPGTCLRSQPNLGRARFSLALSEGPLRHTAASRAVARLKSMGVGTSAVLGAPKPGGDCRATRGAAT